MTAPALTDHLFTFDEWTALPAYERFKVEVVEGVLNVSPRGHALHQRAILKLASQLDSVLPRQLCALGEVDVVLTRTPLSVRVPDVVVVDSELAQTNPARFEAADVRLAVEILSDGTRRVDRVMKFAEYAEAGIPQYWMIELSPPTSLRAFTSVDGRYEADRNTSRMSVAGHPVDLALDLLTER
ncbi:Uma2 family endonuclease [Skermania sp. ID1734]|uniref:Uma2 family endonuclease n=1 Tax=Skermania sp. ID1734 TaxID=2597516 RepID=UPI0021061D53|nr:Uma2 family endonuclease [Skermania sp. ID1734]